MSAVAIVVVVGAVAAVLIVSGGKPAHRGKSQTVALTNALLSNRQLYVATQQASYSALLPAGWNQNPATAGTLQDGIRAQSPVVTGERITIGAVAKASTRFPTEAASLLKQASALSGFHRGTSASTNLSGGRPGWAISYQASGLSNAYYLVQSCGTMYAASASAPPAQAELLRPRLSVVAATLRGNC